MDDGVDEESAVFAITAAAQLSGMHPQTLRQYDRLGLVVPARTQGGSRRYSLRHVKQLREVAALSAEGMSLPAISRIIELENETLQLRRRVADVELRLREEIEQRSRIFAAGTTGSVVTLRQGTRVRRATEIVPWRPDGEIESRSRQATTREFRAGAPGTGGRRPAAPAAGAHGIRPAAESDRDRMRALSREPIATVSTVEG